MLPEDIDDYIPKIFDRDDSLNALISKINQLVSDTKSDIMGIGGLKDPSVIPSNFLTDIGDFLNAGILTTDSDREKCEKIATAVAGHKIRGSWTNDAKPKVDLVAAGDSQIFRSFDGDDWILTGDGLTPSAYYWASMGADGIDDDLGLALIGAGDEIEVAGNIYIDVDNSSLTAVEQESIRLVMLDLVPAYFKVHFGYLNVGGQFIEYFVMG